VQHPPRQEEADQTDCRGKGPDIGAACDQQDDDHHQAAERRGRDEKLLDMWAIVLMSGVVSSAVGRHWPERDESGQDEDRTHRRNTKQHTHQRAPQQSDQQRDDNADDNRDHQSGRRGCRHSANHVVDHRRPSASGVR
jgi:hypothetical protein